MANSDNSDRLAISRRHLDSSLSSLFFPHYLFPFYLLQLLQEKIISLEHKLSLADKQVSNPS